MMSQNMIVLTGPGLSQPDNANIWENVLRGPLWGRSIFWLDQCKSRMVVDQVDVGVGIIGPRDKKLLCISDGFKWRRQRTAGECWNQERSYTVPYEALCPNPMQTFFPT
jgi:hypothetical protein